MASSEAEAWAAYRPLIQCLDPERIEDALRKKGIPDVNILTGWIENKFLSRWPTNPDHKKQFPKYYPEQRAWARKRIAAGGRVWLMLYVAESKEWLLFDGAVAAAALGICTERQLKACALAVWQGTVPGRLKLLSLLGHREPAFAAERDDAVVGAPI